MYFLGYFFKFYIIVLIFRLMLTQQELTFNPLGQLIAKLTNPVFDIWRRPKSFTDKFIPLLIILIILVYAFLSAGSIKGNFASGFSLACQDMVNFIAGFMVFCILLGAIPGSYGSLPLFFYRLGNMWVSMVRKIFPVRSNLVIIPSLLVLFLIYCFATLLITLIATTDITPRSFALMINIFLVAFLIKCLSYYEIILLVRIIMSWISVDRRNLLVQFVYNVTEFVLAPVRRVIPPLGMFDLSPIVVFFLIHLIKRLMYNLIIF